MADRRAICIGLAFAIALAATAALAFSESLMEIGTRVRGEASLASGTVALRWQPERQSDALVVRPGVRVPCSLNGGTPVTVKAGGEHRVLKPYLGVCLSPSGPGLVYYR